MLVLVELNLVEPRYQAVLEVLNDGATVTNLARRNGVSRQTIHVWLRRYANDDCRAWWGSPKPLSCPHQMSPVVEAPIVEMRREQLGWSEFLIGLVCVGANSSSTTSLGTHWPTHGNSAR